MLLGKQYCTLNGPNHLFLNLPTLLQIMTFFTRNFDQKVALSDISKKNHLSHFGHVIFDMTNLTSDLFH
jgi:hypothetical protein